MFGRRFKYKSYPTKDRRETHDERVARIAAIVIVLLAALVAPAIVGYVILLAVPIWLIAYPFSRYLRSEERRALIEQYRRK